MGDTIFTILRWIETFHMTDTHKYKCLRGSTSLSEKTRMSNHLLMFGSTFWIILKNWVLVRPESHPYHHNLYQPENYFKINLITFKCLNNQAPSYLKQLLTLYRPNRALRSSSDKLKLVTVPYNLKTYGYRSYSVHAPILWNSLPFNIRSAENITSFKSKLKTHLFKLAYEL